MTWLQDGFLFDTWRPGSCFNITTVFPYIGPIIKIKPQITKFMGPTWGPLGPVGPQMGPMLVPWTLLSGTVSRTSYLYYENHYTGETTFLHWNGHVMIYIVIAGLSHHWFRLQFLACSTWSNCMTNTHLLSIGPLQINWKYPPWRKCIRKYHLYNDGHFV